MDSLLRLKKYNMKYKLKKIDGYYVPHFKVLCFWFRTKENYPQRKTAQQRVDELNGKIIR